MQLRNLKKICFILVVFFVGIVNVNASGNYTVSLSSTSVTKGKSVTLYIKANNCAGRFDIFSSDSTVASVSETYSFIDNSTATVIISGLNTGTATIKIKATDVTDYDGKAVSGTKTLTLKVTNSSANSGTTNKNGGGTSNQSSKKSSDATLKSLSIEGINITPEFRSDVLEYAAEVEAGVEKVKVNATSNDGKATVSGIGEIEVKEGINKLNISVTAEDGSAKTYVINVIVKEKEPITVKMGNKEYTVIRKEDDLPNVDLFEKCKVKIGEEEVVGYYNEVLDIYLVGLRDEKNNIGMYIYDADKNTYTKYNWITVGGVTLYLKNGSKEVENFIKYKGTINDMDVSLYKISSKEKMGLIYGTNVKTGNTGWYLYDEDEETLARYYNKEVDIYKNKISNYKNYLMIFMGFISATIIILVIVSLISGKRRKKKSRRIKP